MTLHGPRPQCLQSQPKGSQAAFQALQVRAVALIINLLVRQVGEKSQSKLLEEKILKELRVGQVSTEKLTLYWSCY
jgi:hypothetical protein